MHKELRDGENVFVIHGFLSREECDRLIARSESLGYEAATVGDVLVTHMRPNSRVISDDPTLAAELWAWARPFLPPVGGWEAVGLHDRFRSYRYEATESFAPHRDRDYSPGDGTESLPTFMIYLNEACGGRRDEVLPARRDDEARRQARVRQGPGLHPPTTPRGIAAGHRSKICPAFRRGTPATACGHTSPGG